MITEQLKKKDDEVQNLMDEVERLRGRLTSIEEEYSMLS